MRILLRSGLLLLLSAVTPLLSARADSAPAHDRGELLEYWIENSRSPEDYVIEKFRTHQWVFLGEYHRIKHDVDLVTALIPRLHAETDVRHLALEFLCRDRTDEANALISSPEYDRDRTIDFFRGQFPSWSYEEYLDILRVSWESNRLLAKRRGVFRLIGLNPCPDFEVIHFGDDRQAAELEQAKRRRYDEIMAQTLEERLLRPNAKALVYLGIAHATAKFQEYWFGTDEVLPRAGNLVYRDPYREEMFFICLHAPFWDSGTQSDIYPFDGILDRLMRNYEKDIGFDVVGTPFEKLEHATKSPGAITQYRFGELYDGYIIRKQPLAETVGVTCIEDWVESEEEHRHFWRHLANKKAALAHSRTPFAQFRRDLCSPGPDHGAGFRRRFQKLPELP